MEIDEELVRCRPCGYVMKESELNGGVCPACGLPHNVFEPYRERVSANRLFILSLDIHPIAIHLSQTFVGLIPLLIMFHYVFPGYREQMIHSVIDFSIFMLPLSLVLSTISGIVDGLTRFKTLKTPLLVSKIYYSIAIMIFSFAQWFTSTPGEYDLITLALSGVSLFCAVKLGLMGKKLLDVILPGTYQIRKKKKAKPAPRPVVPIPKAESLDD